MTKTSLVRYVALLRTGKSHVLTVNDGNIRRPLEHETKIHGSTIVGKFGSFSTAERAARLAERGWRRCPDARKTGT
jgi:hypothetical protein